MLGLFKIGLIFMALTDAGLTVAGTVGGQVNLPPVIVSTPNPIFIEGIANTYDMSQNFTDDDQSTVITSLTNILPNGLSYDGNTHILDYDGIGISSVSQHQLNVDDQVNDAVISSSFDIGIVLSSARVGILQELTFQTDAYGARENFTDGASYSFYTGPGDGILTDFDTNGGIFTANSDLKSVVLADEEPGMVPLEGTRVAQMRLRYEQSYNDINGSGQSKPRININWGLRGDNTNWQPYDTEWWLAFVISLPADFYIDKRNGNPTYPSLNTLHTFQQFSTIVTAGGAGGVHIGGPSSRHGKWEVRRKVGPTSTSGSGVPEIHAWLQDIDTDIGENVLFIIRYRLNPYSVDTTVDGTMGTNAQVGEFFEGNKGIFQVWKSMAAGASGISVDLGTVTNSSGSRAMKQIININGAPVGLVPEWRNGNVGQSAHHITFNHYKANYTQRVWPNPPAIPHENSASPSPLIAYLSSCRLGDSTSSYSDVHPTRESEPA